MQANVIYGRNHAIHVGHADYFVPKGEFLGFTLGRQFGLGGEFYEHKSSIRHSALSIQYLALST